MYAVPNPPAEAGHRSPRPDHVLTEAAPTDHPHWCDPAACETVLGNGHSSTPVKIGADRQSPSRVQVRMWQQPATPWAADPPPWVEIVTGTHGSGQRLRVDLSSGQATALRGALTELDEKIRE
jgi:hypothetical protein